MQYKVFFCNLHIQKALQKTDIYKKSSDLTKKKKKRLVNQTKHSNFALANKKQTLLNIAEWSSW